MKRLAAFMIFASLIAACSPVGPKRSFSDWEPRRGSESAEGVEGSESSLPTTATPMPMPTSNLQTPKPTKPSEPVEPYQLSEPSQPSEPPQEFEYAFPPPMPFTKGSTPTEFGIQINGCDKDVGEALSVVKSMGLTWIKQQSRWANIETAPNAYDWRCLDRVIPVANAQGFKVLISVTTAPAHTRQIYKGIFDPTNGRPADLRDFGLFIARLMQRYPMQIQAIEMWNESNLIREWGDTLDGSVYAQMLAIGYGVAKFMDPSVIVISAGLAPTGFNTRWTHVDDVGFLQKMLEYQAANYMDCLGAHANGPDGVGDINLVAERYFQIAGEHIPICVSELGVGIPVEGQAPEGFDWVMTHTPEQQRDRLLNGMAWAQSSGYVRLVILWNLNYDGGTNGANDPNAPYALLRKDWRSPAIPAIADWLRK